MAKQLTWDDAEDIGILLSETHPELDPLAVRFTDLHRYVMLLQLVADGDKDAMRVLFARHNVRVFRFLTRIVGNEATAEDLLNEVFLEVLAQRRPVRGAFAGIDMDFGYRALQGAGGDAAPPARRAR